VPDKAVISHRGEKYEIGRGKRFYGIWVVGAPYEAPVDRWPENRDGWQQAWSRFASMEPPGTIEALTRDRKSGPGRPRLAGLLRRPRGGAALLAGEGLLVLGVVLGLAGLFPAYEGGQSLISQANEVVPHLFYVMGWLLTAALVALSVARPSNAARLGGLFGLGISAVTFGLFLADLGQLSGSVSLGSGLVVSLLGWLACTAGAALALASGTPQPAPGQQGQPQLSRPVRPTRAHAGPLALLVLAGIGTAAAFAPSWDSYTLVATASGTSQTITAGNAFDNPAAAIAGNVLVMVAVIAVAVVAALWRPARQGGFLLAGAIVALAAETVSALIQAGQPATPAMFGISSAQASSLGLTISTGLTASFWVFLVFVISLLVSCAWLFTEPDHPAMHGFPASPWLPAGGDQGTAGAAGTAADEDADSEAASEGRPDSDVSGEDNDVNGNADSQDAESGASDSPRADSRITEQGAADSTPQSEGGGESAYA
jgi:hypothetical protein